MAEGKSRRSSGSYKPGQCGNPGGRPKSSLASVLAKYGELRKNGKSNAERLAETAWQRAIDGELEWAAWLAERILGKAPQAVEFGSSDGAPVRFTLDLGQRDAA